MENICIPKLKAIQIISNLGIRDHEDIIKYLEQICIERGAFVKYDQLTNGEGRCVINGDKKKTGMITVNKNDLYPTRTRFSIGHELGHFELHANKKLNFICKDEDYINWKEVAENMELEANQFASELLLPSKFIVEEIRGVQPSFDLIKSLSEKYQTSLTATAYKVIELTDFNAALVGYAKEKVSYVKRSKSFQDHRLWIAPSEPLSKDTLAYQFIQKTNPNKRLRLYPECWIEDTSAISRKMLLEESHYFESLKFGFSILNVVQ